MVEGHAAASKIQAPPEESMSAPLIALSTQFCSPRSLGIDMKNIENDGNEPESWGQKGERMAARMAKAGGGLLRIGGIALLVYVVGMAVFAISKYSATKSTLLSYGMSDATGSLIAWAVMLIAIGIPGLAIVRLFFFRGRPYDYAAAMLLPLISWGMVQIPANFNATTGEALRFCASRPDNSLFCLDYPGIDPITQKKLVAMNPAVADLEFRRNKGLAPKRIAQSVVDVVFFDPLTAQPRVWVHKNDQGCFDMFDNPGADPRSGEQLSPITKEDVRLIVECANRTLRNQERVQAATPQAAAQAPARTNVLTMTAGGDSSHVSAPPGHSISFTGSGFTTHCVYTDGHEGIVGDSKNPCSSGPMLYQFVRDTTGKANAVTYVFN